MKVKLDQIQKEHGNSAPKGYAKLTRFYGHQNSSYKEICSEYHEHSSKQQAIQPPPANAAMPPSM